jgi:hypothetical protein
MERHQFRLMREPTPVIRSKPSHSCGRPPPIRLTPAPSSLALQTKTNVPPVISWVVPTNNSTFIQPKTITLTASATDADGTVTNVAFFNGTTLLGNVTSGVGNQYSLTWSNAAVGSYTLSARATDNSGATNKSPPPSPLWCNR